MMKLLLLTFLCFLTVCFGWITANVDAYTDVTLWSQNLFLLVILFHRNTPCDLSVAHFQLTYYLVCKYSFLSLRKRHSLTTLATGRGTNFVRLVWKLRWEIISANLKAHRLKSIIAREILASEIPLNSSKVTWSIQTQVTAASYYCRNQSYPKYKHTCPFCLPKQIQQQKQQQQQQQQWQRQQQQPRQQEQHRQRQRQREQHQQQRQQRSSDNSSSDNSSSNNNNNNKKSSCSKNKTI